MQRAAQQTTLGNLRIELLCTQRFMNPDLFDLLKSQALFDHLPEPLRELWNNSMAVPKEAMDIGEMIAEEAVHAITVGEAPESVWIIT